MFSLLLIPGEGSTAHNSWQGLSQASWLSALLLSYFCLTFCPTWKLIASRLGVMLLYMLLAMHPDRRDIDSPVQKAFHRRRRVIQLLCIKVTPRQLPTMSSRPRCRMIYCVSRLLPPLIIVWEIGLLQCTTPTWPSLVGTGVWDMPSGISSIKHFKTSFEILQEFKPRS